MPDRQQQQAWKLLEDLLWCVEEPSGRHNDWVQYRVALTAQYIHFIPEGHILRGDSPASGPGLSPRPALTLSDESADGTDKKSDEHSKKHINDDDDDDDDAKVQSSALGRADSLLRDYRLSPRRTPSGGNVRQAVHDRRNRPESQLVSWESNPTAQAFSVELSSVAELTFLHQKDIPFSLLIRSATRAGRLRSCQMGFVDPESRHKWSSLLKTTIASAKLSGTVARLTREAESVARMDAFRRDCMRGIDLCIYYAEALSVSGRDRALSLRIEMFRQAAHRLSACLELLARCELENGLALTRCLPQFVQTLQDVLEPYASNDLTACQLRKRGRLALLECSGLVDLVHRVTAADFLPANTEPSGVAPADRSAATLDNAVALSVRIQQTLRSLVADVEALAHDEPQPTHIKKTERMASSGALAGAGGGVANVGGGAGSSSASADGHHHHHHHHSKSSRGRSSGKHASSKKLSTTNEQLRARVDESVFDFLNPDQLSCSKRHNPPTKSRSFLARSMSLTKTTQAIKEAAGRAVELSTSLQGDELHQRPSFQQLGELVDSFEGLARLSKSYVLEASRRDADKQKRHRAAPLQLWSHLLAYSSLLSSVLRLSQLERSANTDLQLQLALNSLVKSANQLCRFNHQDSRPRSADLSSQALLTASASSSALSLHPHPPSHPLHPASAATNVQLSSSSSTSTLALSTSSPTAAGLSSSASNGRLAACTSSASSPSSSIYATSLSSSSPHAATTPTPLSLVPLTSGDDRRSSHRKLGRSTSSSISSQSLFLVADADQELTPKVHAFSVRELLAKLQMLAVATKALSDAQHSVQTMNKLISTCHQLGEFVPALGPIKASITPEGKARICSLISAAKEAAQLSKGLLPLSQIALIDDILNFIGMFGNLYDPKACEKPGEDRSMFEIRKEFEARNRISDLEKELEEARKELLRRRFTRSRTEGL